MAAHSQTPVASWLNSTRAIALTTTMSRVLWQLALSADAEHKESAKRDTYRHTSPKSVHQQLQHTCKEFNSDEVDEIIRLMEQKKVCWIQGDRLTYRLSAHNPIALARHLLHETRPDHDLRYFVWRNIRTFYRFAQSAQIAHQMHALAAVVNGLISPRRSQVDSDEGVSWDIHKEIIPLLRRKVGEDFTIPIRIIEFFLECCRAVNYARLSDRVGRLDLRAQEIDPEFLLCQLFGVPTSIKGLDDLFGGGGLMLTEDASDTVPLQLGGRAVLTIGPFGTGKSLLALQMAVEVARKGGAAWFMPMEQSAEECLYSLESVGCLPDGIPIRIATTVPQAIELLDREKRDPDSGVLILIRTIKERFTDFAVAFEENSKAMCGYALRLIIVDPVSAIMREPGNGTLRGQMMEMFEAVKRAGTNIWLVSEDSDAFSSSIEQGISDTVVYLSSEQMHGYTQRSIEIKKSRLQREQRGLHPFSIGPNGGFTVYPSSAAVRSKLQKRTVRRAEIKVRFGCAPIDTKLKSANLFSGDVIVLQGPSGCGKTPAALRFLMSPDLPRPKNSTDAGLLLVNLEAVTSFRGHLVDVYENLRSEQGACRHPNDIIIVGLPGGFVKPGYVLQRIETAFEEAGFRRRPIARVVFDNVVNMELGCPFVSADPNFGDTLVDLIRKHGSTSLFVCRDELGREGPSLQRAILNSADCLVRFCLVKSTALIEVVKSRGGRHETGSVELSPATAGTAEGSEQ